MRGKRREDTLVKNRLEDFDLRDLIFVDANIFIDHGSANPIYGKFCEEFLEKVESKIVMAIGKSI